jgi:hypothetical protein
MLEFTVPKIVPGFDAKPAKVLLTEHFLGVVCEVIWPGFSGATSKEIDRVLCQAHRDRLPNRVELLHGACTE